MISPLSHLIYPQLVQPPQLAHEQEPQHDVLLEELDPLVAPVSESNMDSETSIISIDSISSKIDVKSKESSFSFTVWFIIFLYSPLFLIVLMYKSVMFDIIIVLIYHITS